MISVVIPVFDNYDTLNKCLKSVFDQSYKDIEIIIVDDGSQYPDKIRSIVDDYEGVKLIKQENKGAPAARNRGFEETNGDYIIFLDADIVLDSSALELMLDKLKVSEAAYCYSSFKLGWKKFKTFAFDLEKLKNYNYIHTSSLIKKDFFPGFDEKLKKFQDWDLWLTLAKNKHFGIGINKCLFKIIDNKGTMSQWYPKFYYKLPWPIFGYAPKMIDKYFKALKIIKEKHNL